ncbi:DUF4326 domain-containing protein [Micromonospora lupini]|uniref:DUF4326 domain-containing protein n=1 Tax=Micromonospora lupini TaxID=285679 RepID=UPI0033D1E739
MGGQPRVRVQGDLYHPVVPPGAVYVGRQGFGLRRSPWANPFSLRKHDRAEALRLYRQWLVGQPALVDRARRELTGKQWRAGVGSRMRAMPTCWPTSLVDVQPVPGGGPSRCVDAADAEGHPSCPVGAAPARSRYK